MKISSIKITFYTSAIISAIIIVWYFFKLKSAGFLNTNKFLSPDIAAYVGGFLAGTIGLLISVTTLIILYQTFFSQNHQHRNIQFTNSIELMISLHSSITRDIENLEFYGYRGEMSILNFDPSKGPNVFLDKLNFIINSYNLLISRCRNIITENNESEIAKVANDLLTRFYLSFYTKIVWVILADDENDLNKPQPYTVYLNLAKNKHDDSKLIFKTFGELAQDTFQRLNEMKIISLDNQFKQRSLLKIKEFLKVSV